MKKTWVFLLLFAAGVCVCGLIGRIGEIEGEKAKEAAPAAPADVEKVDVDLTKVSETVKFGYWARLASRPDEFAGKTLRVSGFFMTTVEEGKRYFGCLLADQMGCSCCAPGGVMEFVPKGTYRWPEDFPGEDEALTVTGRLQMLDRNASGLGPNASGIPCLVDADILAPRN